MPGQHRESKKAQCSVALASGTAGAGLGGHRPDCRAQIVTVGRESQGPRLGREVAPALPLQFPVGASARVSRLANERVGIQELHRNRLEVGRCRWRPI